MTFDQPVRLGRTGLTVGRLGIASGYWAPTDAIEEAFERGCNYMTWGTFVKGRSPHMLAAIRHIVAKGQRDKLVLGMFSYAHNAFLTEHYLLKGLKQAGLSHTDVLILGFYSGMPSAGVIAGAQRLKEKGLVRFIGLSGHDRKQIPKLAATGIFDLFHIRYNAVHRGAETDIFPAFQDQGQPGLVNFTTTAWGKLLKPAKMPTGETPPSAVDCYRFALSQPAIHVCMTGAKTAEHMRQNLAVLDLGPMNPDELQRMRRIGDHLYGRRRTS
jgi:aryl-alcohol dehydrogenase-like predicted oxidoreductase